MDNTVGIIDTQFAILGHPVLADCSARLFVLQSMCSNALVCGNIFFCNDTRIFLILVSVIIALHF